MCGRYKLEPASGGWQGLEALLRPADIEALRGIEARPDIRPTHSVPVIRRAAGESAAKLVHMRWGFVPSWWKNAKLPQSTFNARAEEAPVKPMWRDAVRRARCLIPATGWYEWVTVVDASTGEIQMKPDGKKPVKRSVEIGDPASPPLCFAGLWSTANLGEARVETCTILTRAAIPLLAQVHDRMPVVLSADDYQDWMDPGIQSAELFARVTATASPRAFTILERTR